MEDIKLCMECALETLAAIDWEMDGASDAVALAICNLELASRIFDEEKTKVQILFSEMAERSARRALAAVDRLEEQQRADFKDNK